MGEGPTSSTKICLSLLKPQLKSLHTFYGLFLPPRPCRGSVTGSFYCCYLQFLLWPPAYKSPTSSFFGIHFASLTKSPLSFIVTIWSSYRPPMSVLDIYSMRCLWTIFKSCLSDNCMGLMSVRQLYGSEGQEGCCGPTTEILNHPSPVGILGWVCVCVRELRCYHLVECIYSLFKTQIKLSISCEKDTFDNYSCDWAFFPLNYSSEDTYPTSHMLVFR